jgi:enoyl-[acyl-carrier protein] reductase III
MNVDLTGRTALVTGCTGLIGRAICLRLARAGARIVATYFSDHEGADSLRAELDGLGADPLILQINFGYPDELKRLLAALQDVGTVDLFVWGAASGVMREALSLKEKAWTWSVDVNAKALLTLTKGLVLARGDAKPLMGSGGRIVALSSLGSTRAIPMYTAVGASKAAMESLARNLALELGPRGITVNIVSPGVVVTRALDHFPNREQIIQIAEAKTPLGRLVQPEDVTGAILFLASEDAGMISGQTLHIDGGYGVVA